MKKELLKIFLLGIFVASYYFFSPVKDFLTREINMIHTTRFLARSLYEEDKDVAEVPFVVKDYILLEDRLYIFPLDDKVSLPIDVMISRVEKDWIEVVDYDKCYTIYNLKSRSKNLYQFVPSFQEFGLTADFFVIEGEDLSSIYERLFIYYEKV